MPSWLVTWGWYVLVIFNLILLFSFLFFLLYNPACSMFSSSYSLLSLSIFLVPCFSLRAHSNMKYEIWKWHTVFLLLEFAAAYMYLNKPLLSSFSLTCFFLLLFSFFCLLSFSHSLYFFHFFAFGNFSIDIRSDFSVAIDRAFIYLFLFLHLPLFSSLCTQYLYCPNSYISVHPFMFSSCPSFIYVSFYSV